ncbi:S1 RNA-binding domain-containing protein [bacterium]|nr:S1 RNA-binding domain-containing protein [bacterium]
MSEKEKKQTAKKPKLPKINSLVEGRVIKIGRNEIYLDIGGIATGVVRGPEIEDELGKITNLKIGDKATAMVTDLDNEKGLIELSFRKAGHQKAWEKLNEMFNKGTIIKVKIIDANTGGLIAQYGKLIGFIPTSQLSVDHFPRVSDGDKTKILNLLKRFIGEKWPVKIIGLDQKENKLIFSEKGLTERKKKTKYKIGDIIEGEVCGLTDFGAFVKFDKNEEGLVHISEIGWRRLDSPSDVLKVGDKVKAKIIGKQEEKYSLSIKRLIPNPWENVEKKYKVGQIVKGKILKINPFGFFVELDPEIHGLAHISEISDKPIKDLSKIAKVGDTLKFKIVSIEPEFYRLGLSLRGVKQ